MEASTHEDADRWWVVADGGDVDEAYDRAVAAAADVWGAGHPLLGTEPAAMTTAAVRTQVGAGRAGRTGPGSVAVPFAADRFFTRRRVAVRVDDPGVELGVDGDVDGPVLLDIGDDLAVALVHGTGGALTAGELVDAVELRRLRCRYKVRVLRGEGPQQRVFVARVVDGTGRGQVVAHGPTATAARREAAAVMRSAHDGVERYAIEVYAEVRRESGPHLLLERHRVAQRGTLRVHLAAEKDPSRTRVAGWVFAGDAAR